MDERMLNDGDAIAHGYGATDDIKPLVAGSVKQRQRINIVAICLNIFVPWLAFAGIYACMSFSFHYFNPAGTQAVVLLGAGSTTICGVLAYTARPHPRGNWYLVSTVLLFVAVTLGTVLGDLNYWFHMHSYYDVENLQTYPNVNVAEEKGSSLMDAGRVYFSEGTKIDNKYAMSFKNMDLYCVAPIVLGDEALPSYDFWAVGKNCCSGIASDFRCGAQICVKKKSSDPAQVVRCGLVDCGIEGACMMSDALHTGCCGYHSDPKARNGLRLMRDDQRPYFRLAVQRAEAAYSLKAPHPLFFYWMADPVAELNTYRDDGFKYYLIGVFAHFGLNLAFVLYYTKGLSKADL